MMKYIRILRLDHWIKQLFIIPGLVTAIILLNITFNMNIFIDVLIGTLSTCFIASANYAINEWLDAKFDKYHPTKKNRSVVSNDLKAYVVYIIYIILVALGLLLASFINKYFFIVEFLLFIMGILYNVEPVRLKDIAYVDALSESINNALRFLIGWFIITSNYFPPISIIIGYWLIGAYLMEIKRFSEFRMFNDAKLASKYRKSFKYYTEKSLLMCSFFYAISSVFFVGIFLIKYRIELILFIPFYIGLFCYYFMISFKKDSSAQKPEKLYREKGLLLYVLFLCVLFVVLMRIDIPFLDIFDSNELVVINK